MVWGGGDCLCTGPRIWCYTAPGKCNFYSSCLIFYLPEEPLTRGDHLDGHRQSSTAFLLTWRRVVSSRVVSTSRATLCFQPAPQYPPPQPHLSSSFAAAGPEREGEAKFGWNSWLPWQHFVPPQRIGTGTGLSMSVCRQDLGHALC